MESQEKQSPLIKGQFMKNRVANIMLIAAPILFIGALLFSSYAFNNLKRYFSVGWGYGGKWYYSIEYDHNFMNYFLSEFWSLRLMYGYILILSIVIFVAALIMKQATEKASLSLTQSTLTGNSGNGKKVNILVKDIQKVIPTSNGISVYTVSGITKFPLLENKDEVLKAFNFVMENNISSNAQTDEINISKVVELKKLLDAGIITNEEFENKKKLLLKL